MALPRRRGKHNRAAVDLVRQLAGVMNELALSEVEVTSGDVRVRLSRGTPTIAAPAAIAGHVAPPHATVIADVSAGSASTTLVTVEAPMVGTFYRASSPTADPYVREGDVVKQGQILCIIEAMKLMNEIESKVSGRISKILVDNSQPVEYGQPLFLIDPGQ
jgi:acetyl-CoA carboxylase biotin carboxyl carrier protein